LAAEHRDPRDEWIHPDLVSSNKAARLLGVSPKKFERLVHRAGIEPHLQTSFHHRYWDLAFLREQLEQYRREHGEDDTDPGATS
jgi:hypothetical protein